MLANLSEKVGRGISSGPKSWALPRACFFFSLDTTSRVRSQSWTKLPFSAFSLILDCEIVLNNHHHQIHIQSNPGVRRQVNCAMMPLVKFLVQATQHVGGVA